MTIDQLKASISEVVSAGGCSAEFFFLLDGVDGMRVKSVDMDEDAQAELASVFIQSVSDSILLNDNLSLVELSSADDRANAVYRYDLDDVPLELMQLRNILASEDFEPFTFDQDQLSHLGPVHI